MKKEHQTAELTTMSTFNEDELRKEEMVLSVTDTTMSTRKQQITVLRAEVSALKAKIRVLRRFKDLTTLGLCIHDFDMHIKKCIVYKIYQENFRKLLQQQKFCYKKLENQKKEELDRLQTVIDVYTSLMSEDQVKQVLMENERECSL